LLWEPSSISWQWRTIRLQVSELLEREREREEGEGGGRGMGQSPLCVCPRLRVRWVLAEVLRCDDG